MAPEEIAEPEPAEITIENARRWLAAEWETRKKGPVSLPVAEIRASMCATCPHRRQKKKNPDPVGWCNLCRCGGWGPAALSRKVLMQVTIPDGCPWKGIA